jgi:hypothetical protein
LSMHVQRIAIVSFLAGAMACSSLRPVREPARFIAEAKPPVVYVAYVHNGIGFTREMANPRVAGDSMYGVWTEGNRPAALPIRDVHSVATVRRDGARTAMLVVGLATATGIVGYALFNSATGNADWYCDYASNRRGPSGEPLCGPVVPGTSNN